MRHRINDLFEVMFRGRSFAALGFGAAAYSRVLGLIALRRWDASPGRSFLTGIKCCGLFCRAVGFLLGCAVGVFDQPTADELCARVVVSCGILGAIALLAVGFGPVGDLIEWLRTSGTPVRDEGPDESLLEMRSERADGHPG